MDRFFVYYNYDYEIVGLKGFPTNAEALKFINNNFANMSAAAASFTDAQQLSSWTLIEGMELPLTAVERVTEITA